jgi:glucokinase
MILAGDVGGTKTALALFEDQAVRLVPVREGVFASRSYSRFEDLVRRFLAEGSPAAIDVAAFGVAGPVVEGRTDATNLPWHLEESSLAAAIPARRVRLLNDLEATAHGVLGLDQTALTTLQPGRQRPGNLAIIAAGTGLGEGLLVWDGAHHVVVASEGGHADFAPRTEIEMDLLRFLRKDFGHVSYERLLSGPGLQNIYRFLRETGGLKEPAWLSARLAEADPSAVISEAALAGRDPLCIQALDLFVSIYGAEAGNLALKALAVAGVFVAGGIAPKIAAKLVDGAFLQAFRDKGRLSRLVAAIPVQVVLEPRTALLGAARVAFDLAPV